MAAAIGEANGTFTVPGFVSGAGTLVVAGSGTLALTGSNTYSGGTILQQGSLSVNSDAALGAVPAVPSTNITFAGNSTLQAGASFALSASRNIAINPGVMATLDTHGNTLALSSLISGAGSLAVVGGGTLVITNSETFTGGTTINAATVQLGTGGATGWLPGNIVDNGTLVFDRTDAAASLASVLSGNGILQIVGGGTLTVGGTNSFSGSTICSARHARAGQRHGP